MAREADPIDRDRDPSVWDDDTKGWDHDPSDRDRNPIDWDDDPNARDRDPNGWDDDPNAELPDRLLTFPALFRTFRVCSRARFSRFIEFRRVEAAVDQCNAKASSKSVIT